MEVANWGYQMLLKFLLLNDEDDGKMRSQNKVESKFNVVTEYRNLNLHQAAFTNDVGSAAFALRNGQPYNSVYKGTLPIHAASLAGSKDVLKMLIDAGADVNAPRLPRHVGAPKESHIHHHHHHNPPGTTGSTALHFAAAGGHLHIITILLENGADSNKCDKNGQLPATLALHCGYKDVVHLLVNHTMKTSQSPDEAIDALEDKIVREEQSKHRRPSLPSIIEQSSSTIKNSTNSIRRSNRNRRYSHSENLANVLESPTSPAPNAPTTPIEESFNLNRAGETFSSENVNDVTNLNQDPAGSLNQQPQHSLRRLVSKQSLASLFSRSRSDAAKNQEALSDGGDLDDDSRPRSNSNSSLSPTVEHTSAPSSPLKKVNKLPKRRSASSTKANKEDSISSVIQDDQGVSSLTPLQPPRNRTNTVSTMSSTNTRSSNTRTTATDDSTNTSPTTSGSFVFNIPMNQSQHAREAHADRQQKRRAQVRQQSSTSITGSGSVVGGSTLQLQQSQSPSQSQPQTHSQAHLQVSPSKVHSQSLHPQPPQRPRGHSHSHAHSQSRFTNLQELPLAEQEERLSSAQAAEMVKRVQKELLALAESGKAPSAIDNRRGSGVEQNDLVERLQRYGETLALEREAKKREDEITSAASSTPPLSNDELRVNISHGETPPQSPRAYSRRQSSLEHNKLKQSHNIAKKNQYNVKSDLFQNDFDSKIPSPLHLSHTTANSSTRYSKLFKGIKSKLTH